ncbi:hypothetical protein SUGI_0297210 [Cryptomeria japonica]|uniref:uncharacterized protein LOC131066522 n=1 Tax=Cryptomeria japonica TaxID=3369 RepID=UPI002408E1EC|nr:uncharacterized protein LOC131066522 [Cryptomeria japonica]XP_057857280.2 uncharacterized protein LOC131066522 [Cryptomeria japonica]GLJ17165.1 hypothetical protein SUGI_0297210 [Cryptomeria japonica]
MKFIVKACNNGTRARTGTLYLGRQATSLDTPCLLLATRKGLPHFITPDLLCSLHPQARILQFSPLHIWECPSPSTVVALGGVHQMLSMPEYGFIAILRDSVSCISDAEGSNKFGASFETPFGNRMVKPVQYMESISALRPNLWSSLPDEVPAWVSDKRNKLSVDRTTRWLDECLTLRPMDVETALGSIVGGTSLEERIRSAQDIASRNVSGFWLGGFGLGESVEQRPSLLDAVMGILPEGKPRGISGLGLPEEVLQGVAAGVDIFDSTYPYLLTIGGYAMTFPLNMDNNVIKASHMELSDMGADLSKINLRATMYRNDTSPLMESCTCYTCQRHTKAYIHHLLSTHEMLAQTLLEIHNTHHYLEFFQAIRDAINGNYFTAFHSWFVKHRREHIIPTCTSL